MTARSAEGVNGWARITPTNRIGGVEGHATVQAVVPDVAQCAPGTIGNLTALPKDEPVSSPARSDTEGG